MPPFAAYPLRPGITFTHYGVAVDDGMRVVKNDGTPMPNVFAAGMVMAANVLGDGYLAGLGVALSAVFGRLAGEEAARQALRHYLIVAQAASSRRHAASSAGSPNRYCRDAPAKPRTRIPARAKWSSRSVSSGCFEQPEKIGAAEQFQARVAEKPSSRFRSAASRIRVAAIQLVSRSAAVAISQAGPETGQSPSN